MIDLHAEVRGLLPLKEQIRILAMPISDRRRVLYRVGKLVERDSRARVRAQTDLNGLPFEPRKRKKRGRMLGKLVATARMFVRATGTEATIGFKGRAGSIAAKQQYGAIETVTVGELRSGGQARKAPATLKQARALLKEGFRIRRENGRGFRRPTQRYITEHYTIGQATAILRSMRAREPKKSWRTILPARSFLGATLANVNQYIDTIIQQVTQGIRHGTR